jgi:hypothetical protein
LSLFDHFVCRNTSGKDEGSQDDNSIGVLQRMHRFIKERFDFRPSSGLAQPLLPTATAFK